MDHIINQIMNNNGLGYLNDVHIIVHFVMNRKKSNGLDLQKLKESCHPHFLQPIAYHPKVQTTRQCNHGDARSKHKSCKLILDF